MSIIRASLSAHCREKQSSRRVSAARVVFSGHCTTKRAEREVLPGESEKRFAFFDKWACISMWEDFCPLRLAMGKPPPPRGEASFRVLPWVCWFVSRESRMACLKLWAGKRALALSGLPWASHLPQRRRQVFPPCLGFAGLFHVKHARLALSRERERVPALSDLPMASHLPQRGRRVSTPCRGFTDLIHVKRKRQRSFRLAASPVGNE